MGTHVMSGTATALVVVTGLATEVGQESAQLKLKPQETEFEHKVAHFGYFLMGVTILLVINIFAVNVCLARPAWGDAVPGKSN
jgi:Mg2+-importing ATPase